MAVLCNATFFFSLSLTITIGLGWSEVSEVIIFKHEYSEPLKGEYLETLCSLDTNQVGQ
jgi:hypothetical protein